MVFWIYNCMLFQVFISVVVDLLLIIVDKLSLGIAYYKFKFLLLIENVLLKTKTRNIKNIYVSRGVIS